MPCKLNSGQNVHLKDTLQIHIDGQHNNLTGDYHGKTDLVAYGLISLASQVDCTNSISWVDGGLVFVALKPSQDWAITTIHYHSALYDNHMGTCWFERWQSSLGTPILGSIIFGRVQGNTMSFLDLFHDLLTFSYGIIRYLEVTFVLRTLSKKPIEGVNSLVVHLPPSKFSSIQSTHRHQNHEKFPGNYRILHKKQLVLPSSHRQTHLFRDGDQSPWPS